MQWSQCSPWLKINACWCSVLTPQITAQCETWEKRLVSCLGLFSRVQMRRSAWGVPSGGGRNAHITLEIALHRRSRAVSS